MQNYYQIAIDTGGTFTDAIGQDPQGKVYLKKVLSDGSLRAKVKDWLSPGELLIEENWGLKKDILEGYTLTLFLDEPQEFLIKAYDIEYKTLYLQEKVAAEYQKTGLNTSISAGEEAPILAARLITECKLRESLPPLLMKLGSTKGTNALLERKGANTALFLTQGFGDTLRISNQQRPNLFALNIQKRPPLLQSTPEVEERVSAQGKVLESLKLPDPSEIEALKKQGIQSLGVALLNSVHNPVHEKKLAEYLKQFFDFVSVSRDLSPRLHYLRRAETCAVNAYLAPVIQNYLGGIARHIQRLQIMSSAGSLLSQDQFKAKDSLLSGPAGGLVGAGKSAQESGFDQILTFDMGGTSTDVARYHKRADYTRELKVGDAHIFSPAIHIETVAAGGGSVCSFDGLKLKVGPESTGAYPGPASYGAGGALSLTDVHLLLGRIDPIQFGIPVFPEAAQDKFNSLLGEMSETSPSEIQKEEVLQGFLDIANEKMAGAIEKISLQKGYDVKEYALLAFGGAGGLQALQLAQKLGVKEVLIPESAGLLSAYGISQARRECFQEAQILKPLRSFRSALGGTFREIEDQARQVLLKEGLEKEAIQIIHRWIFLRLKGQELSLELAFEENQDLEGIFLEEYQQIYGYRPDQPDLEVESIRVQAQEKEGRKKVVTQKKFKASYPKPHHFQKAFFKGTWQEVGVYLREDLEISDCIQGPALLLDAFSTTVIEADWHLELDQNRMAIIRQQKDNQSQEHKSPEAVELELFSRRFMNIAENMGARLERTAFSVNVKERLDFSCAILNPKGELIANAPHIPVHLGSLGVCVRSVMKVIDFKPGDTVICNHPAYGGSHLPDVTLITPVFSELGELAAFVVNRAHHAEIGGTRPGSMPPNARNLAEEGVVISPFKLVESGKVHWEKIRQLLSAPPYPSRSIRENLADLNAGLAANQLGLQTLEALLDAEGQERVHHYMEEILAYTQEKMKKAWQALEGKSFEAEEYLDDGSPLKVRISTAAPRPKIDFEGSAGVHPHNLNANPAIVNSVVMYVLRLLLSENVPLNEGFLRNLELNIPQNSILSPVFPDDPEEAPAVVGGNVETSQRLTDTLLKALGLVAGSQGTMNNLLFGNERFGYYETIGGGTGAGPNFEGADAVQQHMTNTRITDAEILEFRYPVRLKRFAIRSDSGGKGLFKGGEGLIREIEFLEALSVSILSQHRVEKPYGLLGGEGGGLGQQILILKNGESRALAGIAEVEVSPGDRILMKTPGGGGFGVKPEE